tara:strand:+ start:6650 stop:6916 length:267 start_codon:yes stop_codon:yes gene_type:complete
MEKKSKKNKKMGMGGALKEFGIGGLGGLISEAFGRKSIPMGGLISVLRDELGAQYSEKESEKLLESPNKLKKLQERTQRKFPNRRSID